MGSFTLLHCEVSDWLCLIQHWMLNKDNYWNQLSIIELAQNYVYMVTVIIKYIYWKKESVDEQETVVYSEPVGNILGFL